MVAAMKLVDQWPVDNVSALVLAHRPGRTLACLIGDQEHEYRIASATISIPVLEYIRRVPGGAVGCVPSNGYPPAWLSR